MGELDDALDLLGEVAVAHVSPSGKKATDAMRRRVHDLLRRAVATKETRAALRRGVLLEEQEAAGFAAIPGLSGKPKAKAPERTTSAKDARAEREAEKRLERERGSPRRARRCAGGTRGCGEGGSRGRARAGESRACGRLRSGEARSPPLATARSGFPLGEAGIPSRMSGLSTRFVVGAAVVALVAAAIVLLVLYGGSGGGGGY